jgi:hypothetical protein
MKKHKLATQLIKKHSIMEFPSPWKESAIRAIMEFSDLASAHEHRTVKALTSTKIKEIERIKQDFS